MSPPHPPKPPDRSSLYIGAGVIGMFGLIGLGAWWHEQSTHGPFPADEFLAQEMTQAEAVAPDAQLTYVSATYVTEDGGVRAAFDDGRYWHNAGYLVTTFRATPPEKAKAAEAKAVPLGAPVFAAPGAATQASKCPVLRLSAGLHGSGKQTSFGIDRGWRDRDECETPIPLPIHCKVTDVWRKAIDGGAPQGAYADLSLYVASDAGTASWHFKIVDHANNDTVVFRQTFADDCTQPP